MAESEKQNHAAKDHNWQSYLFELIVVFLGVTAGFFLNNWKMDQQEKHLERKYLNGFHQDVTANIDELEKAVISDSLWLARARPNLVSIQNGTMTSDSANSMIKFMITLSKIDIQQGTYEDITNSGNLNIISDYQLKSRIVDYQMAIEGVEFVDEYFYGYFNDYLMPFLFSNFDFLKGKIVNRDILKMTRFSNIVTGYYSMIQQRMAAYKDLLNRSRELKSILSSNISNIEQQR